MNIITHFLPDLPASMVLCLPAHSLGVEGAVLPLMLLLLQLHHLHTLLLLPHSNISALCSRICLPDLLHSYLTLHNFLASIPRLVNTRVIFLLAGGVVHVHHLHLAQGPLLLHLLVVHLCAAVVEISGIKEIFDVLQS